MSLHRVFLYFSNIWSSKIFGDLVCMLENLQVRDLWLTKREILKIKFLKCNFNDS